MWPYSVTNVWDLDVSERDGQLRDNYILRTKESINENRWWTINGISVPEFLTKLVDRTNFGCNEI